jgi:hypothetical protein
LHKKIIKPIFFLIILFGLFLVPCLAQEKKESITIHQEDLPKYKNPISPIYCEEALLYIENAILRARKLPESNLIFILHLGSGESNKLATLRRKQFRNYLNKSEISSVVALGENVKGNGSWNIYLEGKLLYSLPLFKNDDFNLVGGCIDG